MFFRSSQVFWDWDGEFGCERPPESANFALNPGMGRQSWDGSDATASAAPFGAGPCRSVANPAGHCELEEMNPLAARRAAAAARGRCWLDGVQPWARRFPALRHALQPRREDQQR